MLLEYNIPVYQDLCETLEKYRKAIVVAFTGCGKSFIANEFLTEKKLNALVVCPKRAICDQWRGLNPDVTAVTYNYFAKAPMDELLAYEVVVLDEAHHCGSRVWGARTKEVMAATKGYVIGLTADPTRWSDGGRNVAEELFDNHIVSGCPLEDAMDNGIVPPFTYVCTVIGIEKTIKDYERKYGWLQKKKNHTQVYYEEVGHTLYRLKLSAKSMPSVQEVLKKHMVPNPKGIVFVDDIAAIDEAKTLMSETFPELPLYAVNSKQPETVNQEQMALFSAAESACIISINMLGEGVHVSGINFVVMLRRTQSPAVFMQQLGRVISAKGQERPVVFDIVGNRCTLKMIATRESEVRGLFTRSTSKKDDQVVIIDYAMGAFELLDDVNGLLAQYKPWTQPEIEILRKYYPIEGVAVCERLPGRTAKACTAQAHKLGIGKNSSAWAETEDNVLCKHYPSEGTKVHKRLPGRSKQACSQRAHTLGIAKYCSRWTEPENDILRKHYPTEGAAVCKRLPGRTAEVCIAQARKLGLEKRHSVWTEPENNILRKYYPTEGAAVCKRLPGRTAEACRSQAKELGIAKDLPNWTEPENDVLCKYYPTEGAAVCKRLPGRTAEACAIQARKLDIAKDSSAWTEPENDILREYYPTEGAAVCERLPGRTQSACWNRAKKLGLKAVRHCRKNPSAWTEPENDILREYYPTEGMEVYKRLPGRSKKACKKQARRLGITGNRSAWTEPENDILRKYYPMEGVAVSKRLPGRTEEACQSQAKRLGLRVDRHYRKNPLAWTEPENDVLCKYYPTEGAAVCKRLPGRTPAACKTQARKLGITEKHSAWTEPENDILRKYYPSEGTAVYKRLPGRTRAACNVQAQKLGLQFNRRKSA